MISKEDHTLMTLTVLSTYLLLVEAAERILFVLFPFYLVNRGLSAIQMGVIFSGASLSLVVSRFLIGKLSDIVGRKPIMSVGALMSSISVVLYPFCASAKQFLLAKSVKEVANTLTSSVFDAIQADEFEGEMRKMYVRIVGTVYPAGRAIGVVAGFLISTYLTYIYGFYVAAAFLLMATVIFTLFYRPKRKKHGKSYTNFGIKVSVRTCRKDFLAACVAVFTGSVTFTLVYYPSFFIRAKELGLDAPHIFATMFVTYAAASILIHACKERIEKTESGRIMVAGLLIMGLITLLYTYGSAFVFILAFFGIALTYYVWRIHLKDYLYSTAEPNRRGERLGFVKTVEGVGAVLGPILGGVIVEVLNVTCLFLIAFIIYAVGAVITNMLMRKR